MKENFCRIGKDGEIMELGAFYGSLKSLDSMRAHHYGSHSWARHFTITLPLTTQEWEWEPANKGSLVNC